jgi:hypothetical protein
VHFKQESQRLELLATVSAMRTEMERCESEIQPLIAAFLRPVEGKKADEGARIPCEICGLLVKVSTFQEHVQRHGGKTLNNRVA